VVRSRPRSKPGTEFPSDFATAFFNFGGPRLPALRLPANVFSVRTWQLDNDRIGSQLAHLLRGLEGVTVIAAFGLPDHKSGLAHVVEVLGQLQRSSCNTVLAVAVASRPSDWRDLKGINGFVETGPSTKGLVAESLLELCVGMMAPTSLTCLDVDAIAACLGDCQTPSRLLHSAWIPSERRLVVPEATSQLLRTARAVTMMIRADELSFRSDVSAIREALREHIGQECPLYWDAPGGFWASSPMSEVATSVKLLCRFASERG
jgi:hypothetical protein